MITFLVIAVCCCLGAVTIIWDTHNEHKGNAALRGYLRELSQAMRSGAAPHHATGAEFLGIWLCVPEPTVDFRMNVRSIEVQFMRGLCENTW